MSATYLSVGAAATGSTSLSVAYPASIAAGNLLLLHIASKYPTNTPSAPSGWTLVAQATGGSGSSATDTGSVYSTVYYKVADGSETGNLSVTLTGCNQAVGCITRSSVSAGRTPSLASATGAQNSATSSWSVTAGSGPGTLGGDVMFVTAAMNTNLYSYSAEAVTVSGNTVNTDTERKDSGASGGDHVGLVVSTHAIASSYATATPVFAMTASGTATNNPCGAVVFVRFREAFALTTGTPPVFVSSPGTAAITFAATGAVTGGGPLAGTSAIAVSATGAITGSGALAGTSAIAFGATGAVTGSGPIAGTTAVAFGATGAVVGGGPIAGSSAITVGASGVLPGGGPVAGTSAVSFGASGAVAGGGPVAGAAAVAFDGSADITGGGPLTGTSAVALGAVGAVHWDAAIEGSAGVSFDASGDVAGTGPLGGTSVFAFDGSATVVGDGPIAGLSAVAFDGAGGIVGRGAVAGSSAVDFDDSGALSSPAAGTASLAFAASGVVSGRGPIAGTSDIAFDVSGAITAMGVFGLSGMAAMTMFGATGRLIALRIIGRDRVEMTPRFTVDRQTI